MEMSGEIVQGNTKTVILLNIRQQLFLEAAGAFYMAGIKQILFCNEKHKFQKQDAGAKLVLVSAFLVRSNTVRVGVDDLIKQNGCLCCCVVILWKFTGKGEGVVPQGKEKFPFQRIIRLKRNKFERKQEGVVCLLYTSDAADE